MKYKMFLSKTAFENIGHVIQASRCYPKFTKKRLDIEEDIKTIVEYFYYTTSVTKLYQNLRAPSGS